MDANDFINRMNVLVGDKADQTLLSTVSVPMSNEEFICINEIQKLRAVSHIQELSFEQTKKLEIYVKTLLALRSKKEKPKENTGGLSEEELIASAKD